MIFDLVRWGLTAVVLLAALIGVLFLTRGTVLRRVRGVGADGMPVAPSEPEFPLTVAMLTDCSLAPGNHVEVALNGDGTFDRLWADLGSAQRAITLQLYYMGPGRVADRLAEVLAERARAGVRVLFLYDAFGASDLPRSYWVALRAAGVNAVAFRSLRFRNLWVVQNRAHIRGIVIDARIGWTGGFGIDDKWLGNGRTKGQWRDTNVRFEGPAVRQLQAAFVAAWTEATGALVSGRAVAHERGAGVHAAALLSTEPTLGSTSAERFLAMSIAGARKSLYVTNAYFAPDRSFTALVADAARRGVDVRILVGGASTDVAITRLAARHRYDALLSAGVRVYEYAASTLHAKTFVVDGCWSSIGTMNFDNRSLALNDESTLMVLDEQFGQRMVDLFMEDLSLALEIDLAAFRRRSRIVRIAEWAANLIAPLL
jgi:cardiolipin synthase A/B